MLWSARCPVSRPGAPEPWRRAGPLKTGLITNSTPTSEDNANAFSRNATRPKVPVRRPNAR